MANFGMFEPTRADEEKYKESPMMKNMSRMFESSSMCRPSVKTYYDQSEAKLTEASEKKLQAMFASLTQPMTKHQDHADFDNADTKQLLKDLKDNPVPQRFFSQPVRHINVNSGAKGRGATRAEMEEEKARFEHMQESFFNELENPISRGQDQTKFLNGITEFDAGSGRARVGVSNNDFTDAFLLEKFKYNNPELYRAYQLEEFRAAQAGAKQNYQQPQPGQPPQGYYQEESSEEEAPPPPTRARKAPVRRKNDKYAETPSKGFYVPQPDQ